LQLDLVYDLLRRHGFNTGQVTGLKDCHWNDR